MNVEQLTTALGWMGAINFSLLILSSVMLLLCRAWVLSIHSKMFGLSKAELNKAYFNYLANYKILVLIFFVVPYFVLRCAL